jgi:hypothetical protein
MESQYFSLLNTVVGALTGLLVGYVTSWYQFRFEAKRDAKEFERAKLAKIIDAEIANCISLKAKIRLWMRAWIAIVHFDSGTLKESGTLKRIPENLNQEFFELGVEINALVSRIVADDVRSVVEKLKERNAEIMTQLFSAKTSHDKLAISDHSLAELTELAKRCGERIDSYQRALIKD